MRSKPVVALPEVEGDLRQAMTHYASWQTEGATRLIEKYDETVGWIAWNPDAFPSKHGAIQRAILKRSYYIVYFLQEPDRTVVLAVLDGRRAPDEIRRLVNRRKRAAPSSRSN
jgi:plasmid stabilization system protein ParE